MKTILNRLAAVAVSAALSAGMSLEPRAEDIDIFSRLPTNNDLPNVIIIWDNSANWSSNIPVANCYYNNNKVPTAYGPKADAPNKEQGTKMAIEKCALYNVVDALPTNSDGSARFNVALMLFNESPAQNSGGYPRRQFLPLTESNKALLKSTLAGITIGDDKGNNAAFAKSLYEAYLMYAKAVPYRGTAGTKWDPAAVASGRYVGAPGLGCGKNNIIFLANGSSGEVTDNEAKALLAAAGGDTTQLVYPTSLISNSDQGNWADEFTRFLRNADVSSKDGVQSIITHAIAVTGAPSDGLYPNFIRAMATQGGGEYFATSNLGDLTEYLLNIFNSIDGANSVFASASLPIAVNAQGTYKNQVFVGMFRPDANAGPRWVGNLKQYQIIYDRTTDSLSLGDTLGNPALSSSTGFFLPSAVSYWTTDSSFWVNDASGTPPSTSDLPDGEVVEKGGTAEGLRTTYATDQSGRQVYTCIGCATGTTLSAGAGERFVDANAAITQSMLGATSAAERSLIINWVRGADNRYDELGPGAPTTVRPSIHGDVLHSRPAVVDYGGSIGTIVFYGGNDGMLHALDGNQTGATAGQELWAFIPSEVFSRFKRLRDNTPEILYPITPPGTNATPRDYFVDGPLTVYQKLDSSGNVAQVLLFVGMRRGGRVLYAFDVSNPTTPKYLWKKSSAEVTRLGQTWSEPRLGKVKGWSNPVLIMGEGYDAAAEDRTPPGSTTMGNAVLVLDALDGSVVQALATDRGVPASVALVDSDFDGYVDRAYAVDLGANIYRIDFETASGNGASSGWTITKLASLQDASNSRKFFYEPDVVQTNTFTAILVGSGDREKPLLSVTDDRFYTIFDYSVQKGAPSAAVITDANVVPYQDFALNGSQAGCYFPLAATGEKAVTAAVSTGGNTYFSTNQPDLSANSCSAGLGIAKTYRLPLFCGVPTSIQLAGGGLPPSPVVGVVEVTLAPLASNPDQTPTTKKVPFIIGGFNPELSGLEVAKVPINVDPTRRRIYWYSNNAR
ncbi:MAG TPA: PilC/PilY family type IV pilus protein [Casimicrobiaceae bacterium]